MKRYFKNIWLGLSTVLVGMKIVFQHLFAKKVTMQYPDIFDPIKEGSIPPNARNRIFVDINNCDGCQACARACPVGCISIDIVKVTPGDPTVTNIAATGKPRKTWVTKHDIDFALCCFCSLCNDACPTQAIRMTQEFEYSTYDKSELLYHFSNLTAEQAEQKKQMWAGYMAEKKKAEALAAKAADAKKEGA